MYQIKRFILNIACISLSGCVYTPSGQIYIHPPPPIMPPCGGACSFSYGHSAGNGM